jgi:hypothetical protein
VLSLSDFIGQRLDEDEATARAAMEHSEGRWDWSMHNPRPYRTFLADERGSVVLPAQNDDVFPSAGVAAHIARHDPARVLREVEAKRAILDLTKDPDGPDGENLNWAYGIHAEAHQTVLRHLAAVYADHPDYRQEWRP